MFSKPWTNGAKAYATIDNFKDLVKGFARCRKVQYFIMTDAGIEQNKPVCSHCDQLITVKEGNRGEYIPGSKQYRIMHYECAWKSILKRVWKLVDYM